MGDALSSLCCRDDGQVVPRESTVDKNRKRDELDTILSDRFVQGKAGATDGTLFDEAYTNSDIPLLIQLINSDQPITVPAQEMHHWAKSPTTIGACSLVKLGIDISMDSNEKVIRQFIDYGGLDAVLRELGSAKLDRVHGAILTLYQLIHEGVDDESDTYNEIAMALFKMGAIPSLARVIKRSSTNVLCQSFSLGCIASIYAEIGITAKEQFVVECNGLEVVLNQLSAAISLPPHITVKGGHWHVSLDALYALEDLVLEKEIDIIVCSSIMEKIRSKKYADRLLNVIQTTGLELTQLTESGDGNDTISDIKSFSDIFLKQSEFIVRLISNELKQE